MPYIEAADPQGVPRYLAASSDGSSTSNPARIIHDIEPKTCLSAPVGIAAAGTTTLVAGVAAKAIRVKTIALTADAPCEATFSSNAAAETGVFYLAARTLLLIPDVGGIFECAAGEDLRVTVTAAAAFNLGGVISYRLIDS